MSIEVTPLGVQCNLSCTYCYQNPIRDAGNFGAGDYDMDAIIAALRKHNTRFTVFGGDPLLVPLADLCTLWAVGLEKFKREDWPNGVQTNGVLITEDHIAAFIEYGVHVGFSMDGPGDMNKHRWAGSQEKTDKATIRSQSNLEACLAAGVRCSLILTLHRYNSTRDKRKELKAWIRDLDSRGLGGMRLHLLEVDHTLVDTHLALTDDENIEVLLDLHRLESDLNINFDVFTDIRALLGGDDQSATCIWNACDPYTTTAVQGVNGQGNSSNCGRTNKEGIQFAKAPAKGFERYMALYQTPQEHQGCQGCRFWSMCKGQCPGTGIDQDWRNRTDRCLVWMALFERIEQEMQSAGTASLSLAGHRVAVEQRLLTGWTAGQNWSLTGVVREVLGQNSPRGQEKEGEHWDGRDYHGDHTDTGEDRPHGDAPHGDHTDSEAVPVAAPAPTQEEPHGDIPHGDHTDMVLAGAPAQVQIPHGDAPHGDAPHGDAPGRDDTHGDHSDAPAFTLPVGRPEEQQ